VLARYAYECAHAPVHADERTAAELRLLNFYLHTAHNADRAVVPNQPGIDPPPVLDGVVPISFSDDREAIGWCMRERVNLLHAIRLAAERRHHTYASLLPSVCGEILQRLGYLDDVTSALRIALDAAVALDDPEREAQVACNLGVVRLRARDPGAAESYLLAAKDLSERIGNEYVNAGAVNYLAQLYLERGELERGIRLHMHALDTLRRLGVEGPQVVVLCQLGEAHQRAGDLDAANSCCQNALWIADRLGDPRGRGMSLAELGAIFFQRGDPATARGYLVQALRPLEQVHDHGLTAKVCQALAVVSHAEHRFNDAEAEARQAVARFREARDVLGEAGVLDTLASVLQAQGRSAEAAAELRRALMIFDDHVDSRSAMIRARLADLDEHQPAESPDDAAEPTVRQVPSRRLPPLFRP
jgi:tetratricopeptide (TPR) repeat protein